MTRPPLAHAAKPNGSGCRVPSRLLVPRPLTGQGDTQLSGKERGDGERNGERAQGQGPDRQQVARTAGPQTTMTETRRQWHVGREISAQDLGIFQGCLLGAAGR